MGAWSPASQPRKVIQLAKSIGSSRLSKLSKKIPTEESLDKFVTDLRLETSSSSDRTLAIVAASILEHSLRVAILAKFVPLNEEDQSKLFDGNQNGPLATFSAKIRLAFALGIIGPMTREDIDRVRIIRNAFAHSMSDIHFSSPEVVDMCNGLQVQKLKTKTLGGRVMSKGSAQDKFIATVWYISGRLKLAVEKAANPKEFEGSSIDLELP
jgi:DNA-binding MltR family transcriptional regulator